MSSPVGWVTANPTLQKVLAHPVRQGTMTTTAVPWQGCDRQRRFKGELIRDDPGWGTLMRHFLLPGPVTTLAFGVGVTAAPALLIAATRSTRGLSACLVGTVRSAVALATITVAANEHRRATSGAQVTSSREIHWSSRPMGI